MLLCAHMLRCCLRIDSWPYIFDVPTRLAQSSPPACMHVCIFQDETCWYGDGMRCCGYGSYYFPWWCSACRYGFPSIVHACGWIPHLYVCDIYYNLPVCAHMEEAGCTWLIFDIGKILAKDSYAQSLFDWKRCRVGLLRCGEIRLRWSIHREPELRRRVQPACMRQEWLYM